MPRYESGTGDNQRFWEVRVISERVYTRHGKVGTDGQLAEPKVFDTPELAQKDVERRILDKLKKGFVCVDDDTRDQLCNPELRDAIAADPANENSYLVYADWLQSQGDPRGQLIVIDHKLAHMDQVPHGQGHKDELEKRRSALLKQHTLGPARLGKMEKKKRNPQKAASGYCELEWRLGFIHGARIGRNSDRPPYTVRELVAELLQHPSAQLLHSLIIGALGPDDVHDYEPIIQEIALGRPVALAELFIADFAAEHTELAASTLGDVSILYGALPRLERLHLRAGTMRLGPAMSLPGLRSLDITAASFDLEMLRAVAASEWPALGALALHEQGAPLPLAGALELLAKTPMPALRHLALTGMYATGDLWRDALRGSPLLRQLTLLDLSGGSLTDRDVDSILAERETLASLRVLDVSGNILSADGVRVLVSELHELGVTVHADGQRPVAAAELSLTEHDIVEFAPDARSMAAARKLATTSRWPESGREGSVVWGRCQGGDLYDVYADFELMDAGCTCPSMKHPCKHALALLLLTVQGQVPNRPPPPGFVEARTASGPGALWQ